MSRTFMYRPAKKRPKISDEEEIELEREFTQNEHENLTLSCKLDACASKLQYIMGLIDKLRDDGDVIGKAIDSYGQQIKDVRKDQDRVIKRLGLERVKMIQEDE